MNKDENAIIGTAQEPRGLYRLQLEHIDFRVSAKPGHGHLLKQRGLSPWLVSKSRHTAWMNTS